MGTRTETAQNVPHVNPELPMSTIVARPLIGSARIGLCAADSPTRPFVRYRPVEVVTTA